jgi:hypothetical protein
MIGNSTDKAILKAFKNVSDRTTCEQSLKKIKTPAVAEAFLSLVTQLQKGPEIGALLRDLSSLVSARMLLAAEFVFLKHGEILAESELLEILPAMPTPKCLQVWLDKGPDKEARQNEIIERVKSHPVEANRSVLAWWLFSLGPVAKLNQNMAVFADNDHARSFVTDGALLAAAFRRDKDGKFAAALVSEAHRRPEHFKRLFGNLRGDVEAVASLIALFPRIVDAVSMGAVKMTVAEIFADLPSSSNQQRRCSCEMLLRLASGLIGMAPTPNVEAALSELDRISCALELKPGGTPELKNTCGLRYLGVSRDIQGAKVTDHGANSMAIAIDQVHRGEDPLLVLEATAFKLGMRSIGELGSSTTYDPLVHEDTVGGLLPGAQVRVIRCGWKLRERVVERAKVSP